MHVTSNVFDIAMFRCRDDDRGGRFSDSLKVAPPDVPVVMPKPSLTLNPFSGNSSINNRTMFSAFVIVLINGFIRGLEYIKSDEIKILHFKSA